MERTRFSFYLRLSCFLAACIHAPQAAAFGDRPVPDVDERMLRETYHIEPTMEGLIGALAYPLPEVRSFAAIKLAGDGQRDAVPAILAALATEAMPGTEIILAVSASRLGAEEGTTALRRMCGDGLWSAGLRMTAAQAMLMLGHEYCSADVLSVLQFAADDWYAVYQALNLLPRFKHLADQDVKEVRSLLVTHLKSNVLAVRIETSHALAEIGEPWAIDMLRNAFTTERDEPVRQVMARYLSSVTSK